MRPQALDPHPTLPPTPKSALELGLQKFAVRFDAWVNHPFLILPKARKKGDRANYYNSQSLAFVIGEVFVLLLRSPMPNLVERLRFGEPGEKLRQIWPVTGYSFR